MNTFIIFTLLALFVVPNARTEGTYTLAFAESGVGIYAIYMKIAENSQDNFTVTMEAQFPKVVILSIYSRNSLYCFDTKSSTYELGSSDKSLSGFFVQYKCGNPCNTLSDLINFEYWAGTYQYTGSTGAIDGSTGPSAALITKTSPDSTDTSNPWSQKAMHIIATEIDGATLSSAYNLPATNTTAYMKCYFSGNLYANQRTNSDIPSTYPASLIGVELASGNITNVSGDSSCSGGNSISGNNRTSSAYKMMILPACLLLTLVQICV
ncbi:unnamed protein product [Moneuplotes crassus]|uniref:Uncharacterized protein n=1 Tax=Euplotes crassus TaxID=5936 RepID=A0AAD2DAM2_EUPCR|nr:unnamed protein product [Moneuplotes crassus]